MNNRKNMRFIAAMVSTLVGLGTLNSFAGDASNPFKETLSGVPPIELPAKAAQVVKETKASQRQTATINVVKAAVGINPAAAPAIVGAIARTTPEMASAAAGTAAAAQPKQAGAIAKAAAAGAPTKAGKIVTAVCRAAPMDYRGIAIAVSQAVPGAAKEILEAVASALPDLKPYIEEAITSFRGGVLTVAAVLDQAAKLAQTSPGSGSGPVALAPMARGPSIAPPYLPMSGTPANVTPTTSGEVPVGGRNYASP